VEGEIRQFFELEDFGPSQAVARARELDKKLAKKKKWSVDFALARSTYW